MRILNRSPLWEKIERQTRERAEAERQARQRQNLTRLRHVSQAYDQAKRKRAAERETFENAFRTRADEVVAEVAAEFGVTIADIRSHKRHQRIAIPRFKIAWRLYSETSMTLGQIGRKLGKRDHSSAWHAILRHKVVNNLAWPEHRMKSAWRASAADPSKGAGRIFRYHMKPSASASADALRNTAP